MTIGKNLATIKNIQVDQKNPNKIYFNKLKMVIRKIKKNILITHSRQYRRIFYIILTLSLALSIKS